MNRNKKNAATKVYTMMTIGYEGATPQPAWTFTAKDDKDASDKAYRWRRYQGFTDKDATYREAQGEELNWETKDSYVS